MSSSDREESPAITSKNTDPICILSGSFYGSYMDPIFSFLLGLILDSNLKLGPSSESVGCVGTSMTKIFHQSFRNLLVFIRLKFNQVQSFNINHLGTIFNQSFI